VAEFSGASVQASRPIDRAEIYVDKLFRTAPSAQAATPNPTSQTDNANHGNVQRSEVLRLWSADLRSDDFTAGDRTYVAQVVAARTGMSQADAEKRVDAVVTEAKTDADVARRNAAHFSFWLTAALLFGAFSASLAAAEGGSLRDGTWNDRVLTPRTT
jgi:hypothetical protein